MSTAPTQADEPVSLKPFYQTVIPAWVSLLSF